MLAGPDKFSTPKSEPRAWNIRALCRTWGRKTKASYRSRTKAVTRRWQVYSSVYLGGLGWSESETTGCRKAPHQTKVHWNRKGKGFSAGGIRVEEFCFPQQCCMADLTDSRFQCMTSKELQEYIQWKKYKEIKQKADIFIEDNEKTCSGHVHTNRNKKGGMNTQWNWKIHI